MNTDLKLILIKVGKGRAPAIIVGQLIRIEGDSVVIKGARKIPNNKRSGNLSVLLRRESTRRIKGPVLNTVHVLTPV